MRFNARELRFEVERASSGSVNACADLRNGVVGARADALPCSPAFIACWYSLDINMI